MSAESRRAAERLPIACELPEAGRRSRRGEVSRELFGCPFCGVRTPRRYSPVAAPREGRCRYPAPADRYGRTRRRPPRCPAATVLGASVWGTGGCPFASRATGDGAAEDLFHALRGTRFETGIEAGVSTGCA